MECNILSLKKLTSIFILKHVKVLKKAGDAERYPKELLEYCFNSANLEQLRSAEKILRNIKRKDVKNEEAWKTLCSKKYSIRNKDRFPELTWREIFRATETEFAKRLESSASGLRQEKLKQREDKQNKGIVMIDKPILGSSARTKTRNYSSSSSYSSPSSYSSTKPGTSLFKNSSKKSLFPKR